MHIPNPLSPTRPAWHSQIKQALDLPSKLPKHGIEPRIRTGVKVWVEPAPPPTYVPRWGQLKLLHRATHRVLCECPACGSHLSVGRLAQHKCPQPIKEPQ